MMAYILLGVIKICDNIILTAKSLATYKGLKVVSSILVIISQLLFYLVINQVIDDNTIFDSIMPEMLNLDEGVTIKDWYRDFMKKVNFC